MPDDEAGLEPEQGTSVFALEGVVERSGIPAICARLQARLARDESAAVICDVGALLRADLVVMEALARLQLTARRHGRRLWLRHASPQLLALLALTGLADVLPIEPRGQIEQREQPRRVEEEGDAADSVAG